MNKHLCWVMAAILTFSMSTGCNQSNPKPKDTESTPSVSHEKTDVRNIPYTEICVKRIEYAVNADPFTADLIVDKATLESQKNVCTQDKSYDETYFKDRALLLLHLQLESSSMELQIDGIEVENDVLQVKYTTTCPDVQTNQLQNWSVLLEIQKDDIEKVKTIIGVRNRRDVGITKTTHN